MLNLILWDVMKFLKWLTSKQYLGNSFMCVWLLGLTCSFCIILLQNCSTSTIFGWFSLCSNIFAGDICNNLFCSVHFSFFRTFLHVLTLSFVPREMLLFFCKCFYYIFYSSCLSVSSFLYISPTLNMLYFSSKLFSLDWKLPFGYRQYGLCFSCRRKRTRVA